MIALCDELAEYGPFHLFRPYNDLRFAKDRPPYKTAPGRVRRVRGRHRLLPADLGDRPDVRRRLLRDGEGPARALPRRGRRRAHRRRDRRHRAPRSHAPGTAIGAIDELKSAPRGYPKDHPRVDLLRRKGLMTSKRLRGAGVDAHQAGGRQGPRPCGGRRAPLCAWLDAHVGPSTLPPPDFDR